MSAPHITGIIANLLYVNPTLTHSQILSILQQNSAKIKKCQGYDCVAPLYNCFDTKWNSGKYGQTSSLIWLYILCGSIGFIISVCIGTCIIKKIRSKQDTKNGHNRMDTKNIELEGQNLVTNITDVDGE